MRGRVVLVAAAICLDLVVASLCLLAIVGGPRLSVEMERRVGLCAWALVDPGSAGPDVCVRSIGGIPLRDVSLVREPGYLNGAAQFQEWLEDQDALYTRLHGAATARLVLEGGGTLDAEVRATRILEISPRVLPPVVTSLAMLLVGFLVLWKRPERPEARALFVCVQGMVLALFATAVAAGRGIALPASWSWTLYVLNAFGNLVAAGALTCLLALFPRPRLGRRTHLLAPLLPASLGLVAVVAEISGVFGATMWMVVFFAFAALVLILWTAFGGGAPIQRLQARWVIWGFAVPILIWALTRLPLLLGFSENRDPSDTLIVISMIAIPVGQGLAILRYRLLDIEIVIRRTLLGAGITAAVLFAWHMGVSLFARGLADTGTSGTAFSSIFITAIVLAFMFLPAQARLEEALDRVFFRNRHSYRRVLARIPDALEALVGSEQAVTTVLERVTESMEAPRALVTLLPEPAGSRTWRLGLPVPPETSRPESAVGGEFWAAVASLSSPHLCDPASNTSLDRWMQGEGVDLLLPLRTSDALVGLLACAVPRGATAFSAEDVEMLRSVAASLAMALGRALAFETIRRMNEELEDRIRGRTAELERTRVQLYQWEKMASLGALAAGVAHELNTPLGVVLSTADQLSERLKADPTLSPRLTRMASLCREAAARASAIVQDLRTFSRPESQERELLDLHALIDSTVRLLNSKMRNQNIQVEVVRGEIPAVAGYGAILSQTFANLLINAIAAIDRNGRITVTTEARLGERVAVIFEDTGPGIPEEIRHRIFEPFFTTKPPGEGTGLGLSLCYAFISRHGGRITEEGKPGQGARFVVDLPVNPPEPGPEPEPETEHITLVL